MKKLPGYLIFVFPVIYLLVGFYFRQVFGDLSLRSVDPEYVHFISGMCVATGKFGQANVDHPASVFQLLLAVIFRAVYFFRGHNMSFFEDAMVHSDLYLSVSNLVFTVIISVMMLWAGKTIYRITHNLSYALAIQTAPLIIHVWYDISGRIYPELLFIIPVYLLQVQLMRELYDQGNSPKRSVYLYAFAVAFGISLKMTFIPFIVLPLFLIPKYKEKLRFLLATLIFFFVLSPQVAVQFSHFKNWMKGIFIHSGAYEGGNKNIIDLSVFSDNLSKIVADQRLFYFSAAILLILILALIVTKHQKSKHLLVGAGITFVLIGCTFIISKQFAVRYFLPALLFFPFLLILDKEITGVFFKQKWIGIVLTALIVFILSLKIVHTIPYMRVVSNSVSQQMNARILTRAYTRTLDPDGYFIIVSQDYGCPFHEYSIMYSFAVGGRQWPDHRKILDKLYPRRFMYFTWDNTLRYWGNPFNPASIITSGRPVYLYLEKNREELYKKTVDKLLANYKNITVRETLIFENPVNHEGLLQLYFSTIPARANHTLTE